MEIDFNKYPDALVPAVIQDHETKVVLMLGFMNAEAVLQTVQTGLVTFFSRSKQRLWVKGESSGNFLYLKSLTTDCDHDTLLIKVTPKGPVCHTGQDTCFGDENIQGDFLAELEQIIASRRANPSEKSYIAKLFGKGLNKMAQKVGEEAVELVIEAIDNNDDLFKDEAADLLFHYLILLQAKGFRLNDIKDILKARHQKSV